MSDDDTQTTNDDSEEPVILAAAAVGDEYGTLAEGAVAIQGSAALALGQIGDSRAVVALAEILGNPQCTVLSRALSAVALGQLGERSDVPVLSRISTDANYRAWFKSLGEVLTIL